MIFTGNQNINEIKTEIIRKSIHFLIVLVPLIAAINKPFVIYLLMLGILGYSFMEYFRLCGINIPVVSILTRMASRPKDTGHFVLGPVTLGLGALIALLIFPYQAAVIAILALAFGDGFASLTGKFFGKLYPTFLLGKSIEGSLACFFAVFISAYAFSGSVHISVLAAFTAMVVEAMPLGDYDNLAIPAAVGLVVNFSYFF